MGTGGKIDWSECPLVEVKPEVESGVPVLRGTLVPADAIVHKFNSGSTVAEISKRYKLPQDRIRAIVFYAKGPLA